jgi:hypothetical protein
MLKPSLFIVNLSFVSNFNTLAPAAYGQDRYVVKFQQKMSKYALIIFLLVPTITIAQYDSTYCAKKFENWDFPDHPPLTYFSIIYGGINEVYKNITYPDSAANAGIEGKVNVWFLGTEMGKPECFKVLETPDPSLSKSVIDALHEVN